jgi:DNA adenine methylase
MTTNIVRSPLPWMGGKYYSAARILAAFPTPDRYDVFVDLFGGAAHVLLQKPRTHHVEVYNDINQDLVNFWMQCRDHAAALQERCRTLPYSRALYYQYHESLYNGEPLDPLERAARWFYVLRNTFNGRIEPVARGWNASTRCEVRAYHTALDLFPLVQERWQHVLIDCRDFAEVLRSYEGKRTLVYADPPYLGVEGYYRQNDGTIVFPHEDHVRLASLLNATSALVALSYYPHPLLEELYPVEKWYRANWQVKKHAQRPAQVRARATELLLCNYPPRVSHRSLWEALGAEEMYA